MRQSDGARVHHPVVFFGARRLKPNWSRQGQVSHICSTAHSPWFAPRSRVDRERIAPIASDGELLDTPPSTHQTPHTERLSR